MTLPPFTEGVHYRQLKGGKYRFELTQDVCLSFPCGWQVISFRDGRGKEWVRVECRGYTVRKGYQWNGCSPKKWVPLIGWVGTPDFEATRLASLVHDTMFQFMCLFDFPFRLQHANAIFRDILRASKFRLAETYYKAVDRFGASFVSVTPQNGEHSVRLYPEPEKS